jgi:hypothetical protein
MTIDTLGYVKRLEAAGVDRRQAEAHAEAMRDEVAPQLATKADLDAAVTLLEQKFETLLWKHTLGILLGVLTAACCCASSS